MPREHVNFEEPHTNAIDRAQGNQIWLVTLLPLPHVTHGAVKKSAADRGEIGWEGVLPRLQMRDVEGGLRSIGGRATRMGRGCQGRCGGGMKLGGALVAMAGKV